MWVRFNVRSISFSQIWGLRGSCEACGGNVGGWELSELYLKCR